ncbi:hypothetical protein [Enhygromyxa salina]|nr:hypothetical protein [Enhygromyxa salina]
MSVPTISFFASAAVALVAAVVAVSARQSRRSLGAFAIALVALIVPLVQLRAPTVAALVLLASAVIVALLGALVQLGAGAGSGSGPGVERASAWASPGFWLPAGLGLLGFVWVLLATGSRQVVEHGPPLEPGAAFGDGSVVLAELGVDHFVPALVVGLLALCSVIAAVLTLVGERGAEPLTLGPGVETETASS